MKMKRKIIVEMLLVIPFLIVILSIQASYSASKNNLLKPVQAAGTITISNGILEVAVKNSSGIGTFTIGTGLNHPKPGLKVLYDHPSPSTTYTTIKVVDNHTEYVTRSSLPSASSGYTTKLLDDKKLSVVTYENQVSVSWVTPEGLAITQVIEILGTDISNTLVRVTLHITNSGNVTHTVGIRYEWDIMIEVADNSWIRAWANPNAPQSWTNNETDWVSPNFQFWETVNNPSTPAFSIYGSVALPDVDPQPTVPDRLVYASWSGSYGTAYDYTPSNRSGMDSAVLYYWNPVNLSPGASREVTAYITTAEEAIETGGGSAVWAPPAEGFLVASALTVGVTSGVSAVASAVTNPEGCPSNKLAEKASDILPDSIKKWLDSFICSKTGASIEHRVSFALFFTKQEIISIAISIAVITFAFSYAKAESLNQILSLIPIVLVTAIIVDLAKDLIREIVARRLGVWSEYRLWYFGLAMFLISSIAFKAPFSSPNRIRQHSPNLTTRKTGILSLTAIIVPLIFAGVFYMLFVNPSFTLIGNMGLVICLTAAFFDTIPIPPMNGKDIYDWSKILWLVLFVACFALYALTLLLL
jgi:Zn-dependent protease